MGNHLDEIIRRLGYSESSCLKYRNNNYDSNYLTVHIVKVLNELSPYAAYIVDNEPFVLFFDEPPTQDEQKIISQKIWNAQIPVAIFCGTAAVTVFNGCTIDKNTSLLAEAEHIFFDAINENSPFSFWEITNQDFWKNYTQQFSGKRLNDVLLDNLTYLTDRLKNTHNVSFATKLVLRLIFIRYLIDRGIDLDYSGFSADVVSSREALLKLLTKTVDLYALFSHLKDRFNGNLFELVDENPADSLSMPALGDIADFLSANIYSPVGQLSLFALYDFNIIPVELISNIYEILLGREARNKDNAFYTPKYLVDYILDAVVDEHIEKNELCKILDPSCGSGVFLVCSYRRMIEKKLKDALYTEDNAMLCGTLTDNIFGIDLNSDAIDVAIFSLYLAILDYKNPKTLKQFPLPDLKHKNLFVCDFFDEDGLASVQEISFDFILGNPPWSNKMGLHVDYCKKHEHAQFLQNNDTCRSFVLRSKDFCKQGKKTICCFVLHSKMLYMQKQPSKRFREFLLTNTKIIRLIELSSVRKLVFKNADAPAIVLAYTFSDENVLENRFEYISMKPNVFFRLFNIIVVEKSDVKRVQQKLLKEHDWAWKTLVYGLTGDIDIIMRLKNNQLSVKQAIMAEVPALICSTGVKYNDGDKKDASHLVGRDFLPSNAIGHFCINLNTIAKFEKNAIDRTRDERLFHAPYCLLLTGIDMANYTMRSVYSEADFVFREVVFAIKGNLNQKLFLLNLTGLFNSTLFSYFNLMLGSFAGIEREKRLVEEVLSFPYVYSGVIATQVEEIHTITNHSADYSIIEDVSGSIDTLHKTILKAFGLSDNEFIDYALRIQIPQLTEVNDHDVIRNADERDFIVYGKYFYDYLSVIFENAQKYIQIFFYPTVAKHYSVFEAVVLDTQPDDWLMVINDNDSTQKSMLAKISVHKINELFYYQKDVFYFEENSFYIIKPSCYKNWHPAIAKLDLIEVTDQILSRGTGGEN